MRLKVSREDELGDAAVLEEVNNNIDKVNRQLLPYQRISKVTILEKPLEMTTTKKVKRIYKK